MAEEENDGVIPESKIREAHAKCMQDPKLATYFNNAPQGAKEYIALMFYCTVFQSEVDDALCETYQKEVEEDLTREDMQYLATYDRDLQTRAHFQALLGEMPADPAPVAPKLASLQPITLDPPRPITREPSRLETEHLQAAVARVEAKLDECMARGAKASRGQMVLLVICCSLLGVIVAVVLTFVGWMLIQWL